MLPCASSPIWTSEYAAGELVDHHQQAAGGHLGNVDLPGSGDAMRLADGEDAAQAAGKGVLVL